MARELRQSTSVDLPIGPFLDPTDGVTPETTLTITQPDIRLKKNGGAWAQKAAAQTLTHEENGFYEVTLDATDTDTLGLMRLAVFETGAAPVWEDFLVITQGEWDAKYATAVRPTAAAIADAVWDEVAAGHQTANTFGQAIGDPDGADSIHLIIANLAPAAAIPGLVWQEPVATHSGVAGSFAEAIDAIPTTAENATAVLAGTVEGTTTVAESLRLHNAALGGKASGLGTANAKYRDLGDTKDRIDATVDADGNRTAVTRDLT